MSLMRPSLKPRNLAISTGDFSRSGDGMDVGTLSDITATRGTLGTTVFEFKSLDPSNGLEFAVFGVVARDVGYDVSLTFRARCVSISLNFAITVQVIICSRIN